MSTTQKANRPALSYEQALETAKKLAFSLEEVSFILLIGTFRIEFHHPDKVLVVESREFDRISLAEEETEQNQLS